MDYLDEILIIICLFGVLILICAVIVNRSNINTLFADKADQTDFESLDETVQELSNHILRLYQMMNIYQYKRRFSEPEEIISAIQILPTNRQHVLAFLNQQGMDHYLADKTDTDFEIPPGYDPYFIVMNNKNQKAYYGDYIVKDANGNCYAYSKSTFKEVFERYCE